MTGVEKLVESILNEANSEAKNILAEAQQRKEHQHQKMQIAAENKTKEILNAAIKQGEENKKRMLAVYGLELRKEQLKEKRMLLDEVYAKAMHTIINLPKEEYLKLVSNLLLNTVSTGSEEVILSKNEKFIDLAFLNGVNKMLADNGKKGALHFGHEKADINGGFILVEGGLFVNCSFDMVIKELRDKTEMHTAQILFG